MRKNENQRTTEDVARDLAALDATTWQCILEHSAQTGQPVDVVLAGALAAWYAFEDRNA